MTILDVQHTTIYRYRRPVQLGEHRLMLRPRDSHDLRLIETSLDCSPAATIRWSYDVFGNSIAIASFAEPTTELRIVSRLRLETFERKRPAFQVTPEAATYPFIYSADDRIDLGRLLDRQYSDPGDRVGKWARGFVRSKPTGTLALLADLNSGVGAWVSYQSRDIEGTQTPAETLTRGWGSCRDFAVLFVEAARCLGFGARLVSGYLYNPSTAIRGAGTTHAWADIYVPGPGWIAYDPTNGTIDSADLIRVAVTRDISQAIPLSGDFFGASDSYMGMTVDVAITPEAATPKAATPEIVVPESSETPESAEIRKAPAAICKPAEPIKPAEPVRKPASGDKPLTLPEASGDVDARANLVAFRRD